MVLVRIDLGQSSPIGGVMVLYSFLEFAENYYPMASPSQVLANLVKIHFSKKLGDYMSRRIQILASFERKNLDGQS